MINQTQSNENIELQVAKELNVLLYEGVWLAMVANIVGSLVIWYSFRNIASEKALSFWLVFMLIQTIFRLLVAYFNKKASVISWRNFYTVATALSGLGWGLVVLIIPENVEIAYELFIGFLIGGMISGSLQNLIPFFPSFIAFSFFSITPFALVLASRGSEIRDVSVILVLTFLIVLTRFAYIQNKKLKESLRLHFQNKNLIDLLAREKAQTENLNRKIQLSQKLAHLGTLEYSIENDIFYPGEAVCEMLGFDVSKRKIAMLELLSLFELSESKKLILAFTESITQRKALNVDFRIKNTQNSIRWFSFQGNLVFDSQDKPISILGVLHDITSQKLVEESNLRAKEAAEQANKAKSMFLSSMSHELRTPLNAVIGMSDLLINDENNRLTSEQMEWINEIARAGDHLLDIINDVLDLAKIESGKNELDIQGVYVIDIMSDCIKLIKSSAEKDNIAIIFEFKNDVAVSGDARSLRQVFINLLSNAIKYNKHGGNITIDIEEKGGLVDISISDTGIGIPTQGLAKIFDTFERLGKEQTNVQGAGIGLAITKKLIALMGGEISVTSVEGVGSRFCVTVKRWEDLSSEKNYKRISGD